MCLPNMKCLKNLLVAKRASKDRLLKRQANSVGQFRQAFKYLINTCCSKVFTILAGSHSQKSENAFLEELPNCIEAGMSGTCILYHALYTLR